MTGLVLSRRRRGQLQRQLEQTKDARVFRRTLAILEYDQGRPITHIAHALGVDRRSVHRWLALYRDTRDATVLWDEQRPGRPRRWTKDCAKRLTTILESSPEEQGHLAANWTVPLLQQHFEERTGQRFSDDTLRRALQQLGYVWKRPRYVLTPDTEREKKTTDSPPNRPFAATQRSARRR